MNTSIKEENIYSKMNRAKCLITEKIEKRGNNTFQKYKYFDSDDLFPAVTQACMKTGICTKFKYTKSKMYLDIINVDNTKEQLRYILPLPRIKENVNAGETIKKIGAIQTYSMRYLFIQAFEIGEKDKIESENHEKEMKRKIS